MDVWYKLVLHRVLGHMVEKRESEMKQGRDKGIIKLRSM